jgi:hypothetical protein
MIRLPAWVSVSLVALTALRIIAAIWAAVHNIRGDYYASMPGAYVQYVNPVLWNSPDMQGAWGYHRDTYFHGPAQYLTLYAMAYFDSYASIAQVLLPVYVVVLGVAFVMLHRAVTALAPGQRLTAPLFAATFLFFPVLQAFIQREFEVVVFFTLTAALWCLVLDRRTAAGALLAYITWFKYVPVLFLGYLGLRRWYTAIAAFIAVSLAILGVAHALFGLGLFVNNNVPTHAAQVFNVWSYTFERGADQSYFGTGFCYGWFETETTLSNVRHGLCSLAFRARWLPANVTYVVLCLAVATVYLVANARLERHRPLDPTNERWRRALEFSIVITVCSCFFFNHYYYLIALAVPFCVLLARYPTARNQMNLTLWAISYILLSAFVVPTSVLSRLSGADVWAVYIKGAWFLWGELILTALLLHEYWSLSAGRTTTDAAGSQRNIV